MRTLIHTSKTGVADASGIFIQLFADVSKTFHK